MILKAFWQTIDTGTHSEYVISYHGTLGYGVSTPGGWMVFATEQDALDYALFTHTAPGA